VGGKVRSVWMGWAVPGFFAAPQDDGKNKRRQKQIPFGDDNQSGNGNQRGDGSERGNAEAKRVAGNRKPSLAGRPSVLLADTLPHCSRGYSRSERFQLIRSPSVVLLEEDEEEELEPEPLLGERSRSL
jgi:hypothetical protein